MVTVSATAGLPASSSAASSSFFMIVSPLAHDSCPPSTCGTMHTGHFVSIAESQYFLDSRGGKGTRGALLMRLSNQAGSCRQTQPAYFASVVRSGGSDGCAAVTAATNRSRSFFLLH